MTLEEFLLRLEAVRSGGIESAASAPTRDELTIRRAVSVGRKQGELTELLGVLPSLPAEAKRVAGAAANTAKLALEAAFDERAAQLTATAKAAAPALDLSMPSRPTWRGAVHPVSAVIDEITAIFRELGFTTQLGPEAEHEWYNFGALNFPENHPAMDAHDTLYLGAHALLRTHTSPVQVRTLQRFKPPVRILAPGMVYRRDFFDSTHAPAFHQVEGLAIDEGISFVDLKSTLAEFARRFYGTTRRTRFGPSYFPFTEPSAQMDVEVDLGDGRGLRWIEILGCGMVHPAVFEAVGYDPEQYTGFAWGIGIERVAILRYQVEDIRLFYENDLRFLEQFPY